MPLFTCAKELQTKNGVTQLFDKSDKVVRRIHRNELLCDNGIELVMVHHLMMNPAYGGTANPFEFFNPGDHYRTVGDIVRASMYVRDNCKLVFEDG